MGTKNADSTEMDQICAGQRNLYDAQLKVSHGNTISFEHLPRSQPLNDSTLAFLFEQQEMMHSTASAELCAIHDKPKPKTTDCYKATDITYKGSIDLTSRVKVGEPVQKSELLWSVPYDVVDEAGNKAVTAWRDVVVEEVEVFDLEHRVRSEVSAEKEREIERAVNAALKKDREARKQEPGSRLSQQRRVTEPECPKCPACECAHGQTAFDQAKCDKYCDEKIAAMAATCPATASTHLMNFWDYLDSAGPMVIALVSVVIIFVVLYSVRFVLTLIFNPRALISGPDTYDVYSALQRERAMQNAVTYHRSPQPVPTPQQQTTPQTGGSGLFSPPEYRQTDYGQSPFLSPINGGFGTPGSRESTRFGDDDIYTDRGIIHPNANGDLRRRY
jgi:hypothetical protein